MDDSLEIRLEPSLDRSLDLPLDNLSVDDNDDDGLRMPGEGDGSELNLASNEIRELLADSPLPRQQEAKSGGSKAEMEVEESGGTFDLGSWA